jgi:hypothetical protein
MKKKISELIKSLQNLGEHRLHELIRNELFKNL